MGSKVRRWRQRRGLASMILGLSASALLLVAALGIFTYQQMVATRQVVTQTATAALRAAVPQGFVGETLAQSTSTQAAGLSMSAAAYDQAVGQVLPQFWPGSQVAPCTATPAGSPLACTAGSYLLTLPAVTAHALHIGGPLVVANIQVAATPPYTLTSFGHTTTLHEPAVAADVAVPLNVSLGAVLTLHPWVETAITNVLYADQGGTTAAASRFLPYAPPSKSPASTASPPPGFCWTYPDSANPACATAPPWTTLCTATASATYPCRLVVATGGALTVKSYHTLSATTGFWATTPVPPADASDFPWLPPPSTACWVRTGATSWARTGTLGASSCVSPPTTVRWATGYQQSASSSRGLLTVTTTTTTCVAGALPSATSTQAVAVSLCTSSTASTGTGGGGGGILGGCPAGESDVHGTCTRTTSGGGGGGSCLMSGTCVSTGPVTAPPRP